MKTLRYILGIAILTLSSNCTTSQQFTVNEAQLSELTYISVNTLDETYSLRRISSGKFKFTYYNYFNSYGPAKYIVQLGNLTEHEITLFFSKIQEMVNIEDKPYLWSHIKGDYPSSNYVSLAIPTKQKNKLHEEDYFLYNGNLSYLNDCFKSLLGDLEKFKKQRICTDQIGVNRSAD